MRQQMVIRTLSTFVCKSGFNVINNLSIIYRLRVIFKKLLEWIPTVFDKVAFGDISCTLLPTGKEHSREHFE